MNQNGNYSKSTGTLHINYHKQKDKAPDLLGKIKVRRELEEYICGHLRDHPRVEFVELAIAGWQYDKNGQPFLVVELSQPYGNKQPTENSRSKPTILDIIDRQKKQEHQY